MIIIKARCLNLQHWFITMYPGRVPADNNLPLSLKYIYNYVIKLIWANTDQHIYIINQWVTAIVSSLGKGKRVTGMSSGEVQQQKNTGKNLGWIPTNFSNEHWRCKLLGGSRANRMLDFNFPKAPFLGFWVIQTGYWPDFNLESFIFSKI